MHSELVPTRSLAIARLGAQHTCLAQRHRHDHHNHSNTPDPSSFGSSTCFSSIESSLRPNLSSFQLVYVREDVVGDR